MEWEKLEMPVVLGEVKHNANGVEFKGTSFAAMRW